jgi:hypothetical protein
MTPATAAPYLPRAISFHELWETDGWQVKVYGIAYGRPAPRPELVAAAKRLAASSLPSVTDGVESVAFIGAHDARTGCFVFVDWWVNDNELQHRAFSGPSPDGLAPIGPDDAMGCVWDLTVIDFERRAWYETVMRGETSDRLTDYLDRRLTTSL